MNSPKRPPVYLDHQASTPLDARVLEVMLPWMSVAGNPHAGHSLGARAREAVEEARWHVATLIGAQAADIIFTSGATEATNIALRSLALKPGSRCVTSAIEHACVAETLADLTGVEVDTLPVSAGGIVDLERFGDAIARAPDLVTLMAVNNEVGTIQPFAEVGRMCMAADVVFHTDATQALGRVQIDVAADGIAMASMSAHKIYGPQGMGALYCAEHMRHDLKPLITGGGQEHGIRPGTVPTALVVGFGAACEIAARSMIEDTSRLGSLRDRFLERLVASGVAFGLNGSLERRVTANLNIGFEGIEADALVANLADHVCIATGSACRSGSMKPSHVLMAMGLDGASLAGSVRIGFGRTTSDEDVDYAVARITEEVERLASASRAHIYKAAVGRTGAPRYPARLQKARRA